MIKQNNDRQVVPVTKTFLPPIERYQEQLNRAWKNQWLTNRGALVRELEDKLKDRLGVPQMLATTNGTLPIQIALKLFGQNGEVITTPFSYVATTSAIVWESCTPKFVDIHPEYLTIDESKIEVAITSKTKAILATHVYGNPCNIKIIESIAKKHNLKVIYDAAHCFDVRYNGESVFSYGDISTCSFHATKLFHCGEGGGVFCKERELFNVLFNMHNFGHKGKTEFYGLGINAKMSELQAAMGLAVLPYMNQIRTERRSIVDYYDQNLNFDRLKKMKLRSGTDWNYCYYPIIFEDEEALLATERLLNDNNIIPRRYFYPSLNTLPYIEVQTMPVAEDIAKRILCLPLYAGLKIVSLKRIVKLVNTGVNANNG